MDIVVADDDSTAAIGKRAPRAGTEETGGGVESEHVNSTMHPMNVDHLIRRQDQLRLERR
jgi:hypothetical protein